MVDPYPSFPPNVVVMSRDVAIDIAKKAHRRDLVELLENCEQDAVVIDADGLHAGLWPINDYPGKLP